MTYSYNISSSLSPPFSATSGIRYDSQWLYLEVADDDEEEEEEEDSQDGPGGDRMAERNVTVRLDANNVQNFHVVDPKGVHLLGVTPSFAACEDECYKAVSHACLSFTWHHTDFEKKGYAGHCYSHSDAFWGPVAQGKIDSGCRNDIALTGQGGGGGGANCSAAVSPAPGPPGPVPPPPPPPRPPTPAPRCTSDFDCSGSNGKCTPSTGACACKGGWSGELCGELKFSPHSSRVAYTSSDWTWGGSPIVDDAGTSNSSLQNVHGNKIDPS